MVYFVLQWPLKQIRELMQVEGLTNDEVKSHLQVTVFSFYLLGIECMMGSTLFKIELNSKMLSSLQVIDLAKICDITYR